MKSPIALALAFALFVPTLSLAGNEGPSPTAPLKKMTIEKVTYVGFAPANVAGSYTLRINGNGSIQYLIERNNGTSETQALGKLSPAALKKLQAKLGAALDSANELKDQNPGTPCFDGPSISYHLDLDGKEIEFARIAGCHHFTLSPDDGAADEVVAFLNQLESLASR